MRSSLGLPCLGTSRRVRRFSILVPLIQTGLARRRADRVREWAVREILCDRDTDSGPATGCGLPWMASWTLGPAFQQLRSHCPRPARQTASMQPCPHEAP